MNEMSDTELPPARLVYARPIFELKSTLALARLAPRLHLDCFHEWMNAPRVAAFWELSGSREQHAAYVQSILENPAVEPLIGYFDADPFGYFEAYWAARDRIAPYYDVAEHDRGVHMLEQGRDLGMQDHAIGLDHGRVVLHGPRRPAP